MSEARALTNFAGNSTATVLVGHWVRGLDKDRLSNVLDGKDPFDEATMLDEPKQAAEDPQREPAYTWVDLFRLVLGRSADLERCRHTGVHQV